MMTCSNHMNMCVLAVSVTENALGQGMLYRAGA